MLNNCCRTPGGFCLLFSHGAADYERLRDEHQFTGNESTARRIVARLKAQQPKEALMHLLFEAGEEAQVDWGEAKVVENGVKRTFQLFCMRLSHCKASFVYP